MYWKNATLFSHADSKGELVNRDHSSLVGVKRHSKAATHSSINDATV
jgi:hypothetical protein